jgi:hypothetical protein
LKFAFHPQLDLSILDGTFGAKPQNPENWVLISASSKVPGACRHIGGCASMWEYVSYKFRICSDGRVELWQSPFFNLTFQVETWYPPSPQRNVAFISCKFQDFSNLGVWNQAPESEEPGSRGRGSQATQAGGTVCPGLGEPGRAGPRHPAVRSWVITLLGRA